MAGIYVHIPFCKKRCIYCDFYSTVDNSLYESYIDALHVELLSRVDELGDEKVTTIYIGGGTPSQLPIVQLGRLVNYIKSAVDINTVEEFTIEINPDDVTFEYLQACKDLGVNRVSMGVQSFVDAELAAVGRRHNASQAKLAVDVIREVGFSNISIDLIYGLPLQSVDSWRYSVAEALKLKVPHISCYNLSYEEGTVLYKKRECGEIEECDEDDCVNMYEILVAELKKAGYEHYEISNFAIHGYHSRHNSNYWNFTPYLGLGASAHSFDGRQRRYNPSSIHEYIKRVNEVGFAFEVDTESDCERYNEYVMINLRTMWGLNLDKVRELFGEELHNHLINCTRKFLISGELEETNGSVRLSKKGVMLADYITRELIVVP